MRTASEVTPGEGNARHSFTHHTRRSRGRGPRPEGSGTRPPPSATRSEWMSGACEGARFPFHFVRLTHASLVNINLAPVLFSSLLLSVRSLTHSRERDEIRTEVSASPRSRPSLTPPSRPEGLGSVGVHSVRSRYAPRGKDRGNTTDRTITIIVQFFPAVTNDFLFPVPPALVSAPHVATTEP